MQHVQPLLIHINPQETSTTKFVKQPDNLWDKKGGLECNFYKNKEIANTLEPTYYLTKQTGNFYSILLLYSD